MAFYEAVLVHRTPQVSGDPVFGDEERIIVAGGQSANSQGSGLSWSRELYYGGQITITMAAVSAGPKLTETLLNPRAKPAEVILRRDDVIVQRGPLISWQVLANSLILHVRDLQYYLRYMWLTADQSFAAQDLTFIVQSLINHHQNKDYGDFGIDTTTASNTSITRDKEYEVSDLVNVHEEITELAQNGFDFRIDPTTRGIHLDTPRGTDKSAEVFITHRGIATPNISKTWAARQFGTAALTTGLVKDGAHLTSIATDATAISEFGLAYVAHSVFHMEVQAEIDQAATSTRDLVKTPLFQPPKESFALPDAQVDDFDPGDTITVEYDPGFGMITDAVRIRNKFISVQEGGQEKITIDPV